MNTATLERMEALYNANLDKLDDPSTSADDFKRILRWNEQLAKQIEEARSTAATEYEKTNKVLFDSDRLALDVQRFENDRAMRLEEMDRNDRNVRKGRAWGLLTAIGSTLGGIALTALFDAKRDNRKARINEDYARNREAFETNGAYTMITDKGVLNKPLRMD